jgi:hypothetical protein
VWNGEAPTAMMFQRGLVSVGACSRHQRAIPAATRLGRMKEATFEAFRGTSAACFWRGCSMVILTSCRHHRGAFGRMNRL